MSGVCAIELVRADLIKYGRQRLSSAQTLGTNEAFEHVHDSFVSRGRFITRADTTRRNRVAVIGPDIVDALFPFLDPLDKELNIDGRRFRVIGVLERKGKFLGRSRDNYGLVPLGTLQRTAFLDTLVADVKVVSPEKLNEAVDSVIETLRRERKLGFLEDNNFIIFTQDTLTDLYGQITGGIYAVMIAISSIGLMVGGVGVMNVMLVSVTERTREIGVRKALGAKRRDILWQFLTEAMTLTGVGGLLGIAMGGAIAALVNAFSPFPRCAPAHLGGARVWNIDGGRPGLRDVAGGEGIATRSHRSVALRVGGHMSDEANGAPATPESGFFGRIIGLWFAPEEQFPGIVARPTFWGAIAVLIALNLAFTAVWLQKVEPRDFMQRQMEESGQWEKIPPDRRGDILEQQSSFFPIMAWVGPVVGTPIVVALVAGILLGIFRLVYSAEFGFGQSMGITAWAFLPVALITTPLTLLVLWLKDDWAMNPSEALQANPSLLLDRSEVAQPLYVLAGSFDLFVLWTIFLLAVGYGVAAKRSTGTAFVGVVIPWLMFVALRVGFAAIF